MKKRVIKIETVQLFSGKNDIRKYLAVDMDEEKKEYLKKEYDLQPDLIDEILNNASIYVDMNLVFDNSDIEVEEK